MKTSARRLTHCAAAAVITVLVFGCRGQSSSPPLDELREAGSCSDVDGCPQRVSTILNSAHLMTMLRENRWATQPSTSQANTVSPFAPYDGTTLLVARPTSLDSCEGSMFVLLDWADETRTVVRGGSGTSSSDALGAVISIYDPSDVEQAVVVSARWTYPLTPATWATMLTEAKQYDNVSSGWAPLGSAFLVADAADDPEHCVFVK